MQRTANCLTLTLGLTIGGLFAPLATVDAQEAEPVHSEPAALEWDRRAVEHLWNRAGFGIREVDVERWVAAGPEALVDHLLTPEPEEGVEPIGPWVYEESDRGTREEYEALSGKEQREWRQQVRRERAQGFNQFRAHWARRVLAGQDPLRDRMTLFWHGVFTSSFQDVRHPATIAAQHELLRTNALGNYGDLLRGILRDPAMLRYLNNDQNRKGKPNENLAREVMELFSLGEGNYTEEDIREVARTLTGATVAGLNAPGGGTYRFARGRHDRLEKTVLGETGDFRPEHLPELLLAQAACARFVAGSVLEYLEGRAPSEERLARYAALLRESNYELEPLFRTLFFDPDFYAPEVVGARVTSPIDYLVGFCVRTGQEVPPGVLVDTAQMLGQDMFRPPTVKGWDEGLAWINTSTFMLRGNVIGAFLGQVSERSLRREAMAFAEETAEAMRMEAEADGESMEAMSEDSMREMGREALRRDALARLARRLRRVEYEPTGGLLRAVRRAGAQSDAEIAAALCSALLAIEPPDETVALIAGRVEELRIEFEKPEGRLLRMNGQRLEPRLREIAHLVLSLPEAQLH